MSLVRQGGYYVAAGAAATGLQLVLFLLLRAPFGSMLANLIAIVLTTLINTEFHRRVTFTGAASSATRRHAQNGLAVAFYATYGSAVLVLLHAVVPAPSATLEAITLSIAACLGGIARFVLLRSWVFAPRPRGSSFRRAVAQGFAEVFRVAGVRTRQPGSRRQ